jgi:hypothetical protein
MGEVCLSRLMRQALMNPKKRDFLFKLLAMRLWIGERSVALTNNLEDALRVDAAGQRRTV